MEIIDSHCHLYDEKLSDILPEILDNLEKNNQIAICSADKIETSNLALDIAKQNKNVFATVGVHPHEAESMTDETLDEIKSMIKNKKVVAIGEIGLDYYYDNSPRDKQKYWFEAQLSLAKETDMPVVIHTRDATEDTISILKNSGHKNCVIHCFSGSKETAKTMLDLGYYISFAGPVTFKNAKGILDVVSFVPDDRFFIETDCPYLTPEPNRGKRNNSVYMIDTAKKIAKVRNTSLEHIAKITYDNASKFYRI